MSTISGNLALLQRTKAGQRALLEEMYPDMDFSTVPFREYGRLFSGRKYVPGFIGGWKAYGRSNSEDASTRDILPDYSGNGRDIRLYNFGFTGMSGYGGYACDFNNFSISTGAEGLVITKSYDRLHIEVSDTFNYRLGINMAAEKWNAARGRTVKVTSSYDDEESIKLVYSSGSDAYIDILLNGDTVIPAYSEEPSTYIYLDLSKVLQKSGIIDIELLPEYPGALVSDGIDDYGQCVKDFALPDDYTVVAIRQKFGGNSVLAGKSRDSKNGAFLFEQNNLTYNYGVSTSVTGSVPALFSYQTKSSYNGVDLNVGDGTDTEEDKFMLFMMRPNADKWSSYALYDLRIYDHSLTAEELQAVKDEMMADYEAATGGGITDITYVADWDGKDRSNDEEEPMRSQWVDKKTGRVINLSNFAYAGISGWNGYAEDYMTWENYINRGEYVFTGTKITVKSIKQPIAPSTAMVMTERRNAVSYDIPSYRIRVSGLPPGAKLLYTYQPVSEENVLRVQITSANGVCTVPEIPAGSRLVGFMINAAEIFEEMQLQTPLVIEQLPLYPGALVSDGVDDYGQTAEAIDEEVGTMLVHADWLNTAMTKDEYILNTSPNNEGRLYLWKIMLSGNTQLGTPATNVIPPLMAFSRVPKAVQGTITIGGYSATLPVSLSLYRLILIREQLSDQQIEFLKWKVDKEHRDWLKAKDWAA